MILLPNIIPYGRWQPLGCQQQQASGWWDAPSMLHRLCPEDFLPPASDPQNVHIIRQKTLALARALQACAKHPEPRQAYYVELSGRSSSAWPHWWPSMGMMLWKPPCWGTIGTPTLEEEAQRRWALGNARPCSQTSGNPQVCRTCWADYCSCCFHCTPQSPFLKRKEVMGRDWCWSQQLRSASPCLFGEE